MWKLLIISTLTITNWLQTEPIIKIDQQKIIDKHNYYRTLLKIDPLEYSEECAIFAQQWADKLAKKNRGLKHSGNNKYGENIFWTSIATTEKETVDKWATEKKYFNHRRKRFTSKAGHYSQMIWKNTKFIGTGMAVAKDGSQFWVCTYYPPGNYIKEKAY